MRLIDEIDVLADGGFGPHAERFTNSQERLTAYPSVMYYSARLAEIIRTVVALFDDDAVEIPLLRRLQWNPGDMSQLLDATQMALEILDHSLCPLYTWIDDMSSVRAVCEMLPLTLVGYDHWNVSPEIDCENKPVAQLLTILAMDELKDRVSSKTDDLGNLIELSSLVAGLCEQRGDELIWPHLANVAVTWKDLSHAVRYVTGNTGSFFLDTPEEMYDPTYEGPTWVTDGEPAESLRLAYEDWRKAKPIYAAAQNVMRLEREAIGDDLDAIVELLAYATIASIYGRLPVLLDVSRDIGDDPLAGLPLPDGVTAWPKSWFGADDANYHSYNEQDWLNLDRDVNEGADNEEETIW